MFKLIFDEDKLKDYNEFINKFSVHPDSVSAFSYNFLHIHSRPVVSSIFGERFIPIKTLVTIRTDRTNEVIVPKNGMFFTDCTSDYPDEHPLNDIALLAAKKLVDHCFDCGDDIVKVIPRTAPLPIGACYVNDTFYVYINVVIDHTLKNESFFKLKDCDYANISDLTYTSDLEKELIDSLAIVYNLNPEEVKE